MRQNRYEYDAFISHAVEDKIPIANELCAKLEAAGLKIWYSGKELGVGDSIEKTIEKGLSRSRYGIVILSPTYLAKNWTIREFYTLLAKEIEEHKVILPVLYNITPDELKKKDLLMADRFAVHADKGTDFVVDRLVREIRKSHSVMKPKPWLSRIRLFLFLSLLVNVAFLLNATFFSRSTFMDAVSQPVVYSNNSMASLSILNEMEKMFNRLNQCTCDHESADGNQTQESALVVNRGPSGSATQSVRTPGRKMTMAVVFQVETADSSPLMEENVASETLNTISMVDDESPFMSVNSREVQSGSHRKQCPQRYEVAN